jgi:transposase
MARPKDHTGADLYHLVTDAAKLYAEGVTIRDIATKLGVDRCTVHRWKENYDMWRKASALHIEEQILNERKQYQVNLQKYGEQMQILLISRQQHLFKLNILVNRMIDEASLKETKEAGVFLKDCQYVNLMKTTDSLLLSTIELANSVYQTEAIYDHIYNQKEEK